MNIESRFLSLDFENPFVLASAPPTATYEMIARGFEAGWAGAVIKTLIREPVLNYQNRFAANKIDGHIIAFENIELLSERGPEEWFEDILHLKTKFPDKIIIGSIMGDAKDPAHWLELARGCAQAGADMVELNFSCPHGYPERGTGSAIGQNAEYSRRITQWLKDDPALQIPIIPKLTPAVADISFIGEAVAQAGADGICAINTFPSLMGFDLKTLLPKAAVNGYSTAGGYSGAGLKPIALRCVHDLVKSPGLPVMAGGGISDGYDAAEFILLGAPIVQVCTAVMLEGFDIIKTMQQELREFMSWHGFSSIADFLGKGAPRIRSYSELDADYAVLPRIDAKKCISCPKCYIACRDSGYQSIALQKGFPIVNEELCSGCSLCFLVCPTDAIEMVPR